MTELLALPYSPWSEKARWALDARRVAYRYRAYAPLIGEPLLRLKLRALRGPVTVPVLTTDNGRVLRDSTEIARWADGHGAGPSLFPLEHTSTIAHLTELSETALAAGRGLSLRRVLHDEEALAELVPKAMRQPLGRAAIAIARKGVERALRKYGADLTDAQAHEAALTTALDELRAKLASLPASDGARSLLGTFSFADIAMTQALAYVEPPAFGLKMGKASRRAFSDRALRERYGDLVAWRDAVYEQHRPR